VDADLAAQERGRLRPRTRRRTPVGLEPGGRSGRSLFRVQRLAAREAAALYGAAIDPCLAPPDAPQRADHAPRPTPRRRLSRVPAGVGVREAAGDRRGTPATLVFTLDYDKLRAGMAASTLDDAATCPPPPCAGWRATLASPRRVEGALAWWLDIGRDRRLFNGPPAPRPVRPGQGLRLPRLYRSGPLLHGHTSNTVTLRCHTALPTRTAVPSMSPSA